MHAHEDAFEKLREREERPEMIPQLRAIRSDLEGSLQEIFERGRGERWPYNPY